MIKKIIRNIKEGVKFEFEAEKYRVVGKNGQIDIVKLDEEMADEVRSCKNVKKVEKLKKVIYEE